MSVLAIAVAAACAAEQPRPTATAPKATQQPPANLTPEQLRPVCEIAATRTTDCAVADARAKLSAEQLAELKLDETAQLHAKQQFAKCLSAPWNDHTLAALNACLSTTDTCKVYADCVAAIFHGAADPAATPRQ